MFKNIKSTSLKVLLTVGILVPIIFTLIAFPANTIFGDVEQNTNDIKEISSYLPGLVTTVDTISDDVKIGFKTTNEKISESNKEIVKLRLLICQDSKGTICTPP